MGGEGSGRPPSVETLIKRSQPQLTPVGNDLFLPNYSGVQKEALKDAPKIQSGTTDHAALSNLAYAASGHTGFQPAGSYLTTESDPVFMALSGAFLTSYTETDPVFMSLSGSLSYVATESDPIFMSLSGSLPYVAAETDPVFMSLSGAFVTEETALTGSGATTIYGSFPNFTIGSSASGETDPVFMSLSGSLPYLLLTASGSIPAYAKQAEFAILSGNYATTSGAYIAHAANTTDPHGATLTQTTLWGTTVVGTTKLSGANVTATSVSGSTVNGSTSVSGASVYATTLIRAPTIYATTTFSGAAYVGGTVTGTTLYGTTKLSGAACTATDITGATLYGTTKLSGAACNATTMSGANIAVGTSISGALFMTTTDSTTSGAERMRNILVGTEAVTALSAAQYYRGTIYLKYTA